MKRFAVGVGVAFGMGALGGGGIGSPGMRSGQSQPDTQERTMQVKNVRDRIVTLIETVATSTSEREFATAYRKAVRLLKNQEREGNRMRQKEEDLLHAATVSGARISKRKGYSWAG